MAAMIRQRWCKLPVGVVIILAFGSGAVLALAQTGDLPKPLDEQVAKAWKAAGMVIGWARVDHSDQAHFVFLHPEPEPGDVPAFRVREWREGMLSKLPDPGRPFALSLSVSEVTDTGLKELAGLKSLRSLDLFRTDVSDAGLQELAGLKLKTLQLPDHLKSDVGIKHYLAALDAPTTLHFTRWGITDAALKELAGLNGLITLYLGETQVTDAGLGDLTGLKSLQNLELSFTSVTDAGLKELAGLRLKSLGIPRAAQTDLGLKHYLAIVEPPARLDLTEWQLTDKGLMELSGLKTLKELKISNARVSEAGLSELQKALPDCQIRSSKK